MTDAFRCNGCGEYYDDEYRFINVSMDTEALTYHAVFDLDTIGSEPYGLLEDRVGKQEVEGHLCPKCGIEALDELVDLFGGGSSE